MLAEMLGTVYGYDRFANEQVLDTAAGLTPEQWLEPGTAGHGSVRDTLLHVLVAHRNWLGLCDGSMTPEQAFDFTQQLDANDYPDVAAVRALWRQIDARTQAYLARLDDAEAGSHRGGTFPWDGTTFSQPVWAILLHVANHGTQHRSEAAAMMTAFGHSPGYLDLMGYALGMLGTREEEAVAA
jgi:uncharacterized damage-inducible protein DinB